MFTNESEYLNSVSSALEGKRFEIGQCSETSVNQSELINFVSSSMDGKRFELGQCSKMSAYQSENELRKKTGSGGKDSIMPEDNSGKEEEFISVHDFDCLRPIGTIELVIPQSQREKGKMKIGTGDKSGKSSEQSAWPKCDSEVKSPGNNSSLKGVLKIGKKQWKKSGKQQRKKSGKQPQKEVWEKAAEESGEENLGMLPFKKGQGHSITVLFSGVLALLDFSFFN